MNVGIAIRNPEHVHFYRHVVEALENRGHDVSLFVREFRNTTALLSHFDLPHTVLADEPSSRSELLTGHLKYECRLFAAARRRDIDVLTSIGGRSITHIAPLLDARSVVFVDWTLGRSDHLVSRLADEVHTPAFLAGELGRNQRVYDGLHELAYLHPDRFDSSPAQETKVDDRSFLVAFSQSGIDESVDPTLDTLAAEGDIVGVDGYHPVDHRHVSRHVQPARVHDALVEADLCVSNLGTVSTEAALLGTPTVFAGATAPRRCRYLETEYGLLIGATEESPVQSLVSELLTDESETEQWSARREQMLDDLGDTTTYVTDRLCSVGAT